MESVTLDIKKERERLTKEFDDTKKEMISLQGKFDNAKNKLLTLDGAFKYLKGLSKDKSESSGKDAKK